MFIFKDKEYPTVGTVFTQVGKFNTLEEEIEFLDAYCKQYPMGVGNLSYFLGGNPYFYAFQSKHKALSDLEQAKQKVREIERQISGEFSLFMEGRK
jgi:hypothetical protein